MIWRPVRKRRERELREAKVAAQDDLLALSERLTDRQADVSISNQDNRDAADEQSAALAAYERGTSALDAATRIKDMGAVSRAIAEGNTTWRARTPARPTSRGPTGVRRVSLTRGTACRCAMSTGRLPAAGPAAPYLPAPPARTRSTVVSSPRFVTWKSTALRSAMSTPASPRRTGAASASVPACSPGSCSARHSHPTPSLPPARITAAGIKAVGDFGGGDFGGGDFGG